MSADKYIFREIVGQIKPMPFYIGCVNILDSDFWSKESASNKDKIYEKTFYIFSKWRIYLSKYFFFWKIHDLAKIS